jgi:hypothetical protein
LTDVKGDIGTLYQLKIKVCLIPKEGSVNEPISIYFIGSCHKVLSDKLELQTVGLSLARAVLTVDRAISDSRIKIGCRPSALNNKKSNWITVSPATKLEVSSKKKVLKV